MKKPYSAATVKCFRGNTQQSRAAIHALGHQREREREGEKKERNKKERDRERERERQK